MWVKIDRSYVNLAYVARVRVEGDSYRAVILFGSGREESIVGRAHVGAVLKALDHLADIEPAPDREEVIRVPRAANGSPGDRR